VVVTLGLKKNTYNKQARKILKLVSVLVNCGDMQSRLVASPNSCAPLGGRLNLGTERDRAVAPLTTLIITFFLLRCTSVRHVTHTVKTER